MTGLVVDLFAGGGGASVGIEAALGRPVDLAINHDPIALAVHKLNHPGTRHLEADIWEVRPEEATGRLDVQLLWASPDCTHFSVAKGDVPRDQGIRSLAWVVRDWARAVRPAVICVENVREFESWGPLCKRGRPIKRLAGTEFARWVTALQELGYEVEWQVLDASRYGAPTRRKRLFIVARRDGRPIAWPPATHGEGLLPLRTAAECIDWSLPCPSIFERKRPLAEKTLWRIGEGIRRYVLEAAEPFVVQVNHGRKGFRGQRVAGPLSTVTATQRSHALVVPAMVPTLIQAGYGERRGQRARVPRLGKPLGTIVAGGGKHAFVAAFLAKYFGGVVGHELTRPTGTITGRDHHALTAAHLVKLRGECHGAALGEPAPTITAGGTHLAEVCAFLTTYYGSGSTGQQLTEPMRTVTAKHRLGLVTVHGIDYQIVDIGIRMLEPHELLAAQFGTFAGGYRMDATKLRRGRPVPLSKADRIRLIGNSVCPVVAEALIRENCVEPALAEAAA